jgi:hypothetical protein
LSLNSSLLASKSYFRNLLPPPPNSHSLEISLLLPFSASLTLRPWRWKQYLPPKRLALPELHAIQPRRPHF